MQIHTAEVAIVGGGLAGILAALRFSKNDVSCILIDNSLPGSNGSLGGFAAFSGAKFSLPPAGLGLLPTVDDIDELNKKIYEVLFELGLSFDDLQTSTENSFPKKHKNSHLREYKSLLLTPSEIQGLIERLTARLPKQCRVLQGHCRNLNSKTKSWFFEIISNNNVSTQIQANAVFYAGGRLGTDFLADAGATPSQGKGLDIGVRIETLDRLAFAKLRDLGPDAKIIKGNCRTFCLNVPGLIYYYSFDDIHIPGGIVSDDNTNNANVGLLVRVQDKSNRLKSIINAVKKADCRTLNNTIHSGLPNDYLQTYAKSILGDDVVTKLQEFCIMLNDESLVDWSIPYKIHMPLLDWHWHTYAKPGSHETSLKNVYVIGDSSGHARGLLQAALGGWIAAEEYLSEEI